MVIFVQHVDTKELCHIKICKGDGNMSDEKKEICRTCHFYDESERRFCYELQAKVKDTFHCNRYQSKGELKKNKDGLYVIPTGDVELDETELELLKAYIKKRNGISNPSYRLLITNTQNLIYEALNQSEKVNNFDGL